MDKLVKTKQWFLSRTIVIAAALIGINALFLVLTYGSPVFETDTSTTPMTPVALWVLVALNIAFDALIIYTRKTTTTFIG